MAISLEKLQQMYDQLCEEWFTAVTEGDVCPRYLADISRRIHDVEDRIKEAQIDE